MNVGEASRQSTMAMAIAQPEAPPRGGDRKSTATKKNQVFSENLIRQNLALILRLRNPMTDQTASKARSRKTQHNMTTAKMVLFASMMLLYTVHASAQERLAKVYVFATPTQFAD